VETPLFCTGGSFFSLARVAERPFAYASGPIRKHVVLVRFAAFPPKFGGEPWGNHRPIFRPVCDTERRGFRSSRVCDTPTWKKRKEPRGPALESAKQKMGCRAPKGFILRVKGGADDLRFPHWGVLFAAAAADLRLFGRGRTFKQGSGGARYNSLIQFTTHLKLCKFQANILRAWL
jgi:hypothetical protein